MEIPRDIWLHLGQFIPDDDLHRLITLNSAFLDLGLNARYRNIHLHVFKARTMTYLRRLMDPAIAKRVRSFAIELHTGFDQDNSKITAADNQDRPSLLMKGVDVFRKRLRISKKPGHQDESVERYPPTLGGLKQALVDAVPLRQLESFLLPAWSTFGPSLRKVTLSGKLASIRTLLPSAEPLPSLRELCFQLTRSRVDKVTPEDIIAPFINSFSATLEALSISSWKEPVDLSQIFLKLGFFPHLRHFEVRVPFDKAFLNTTDGLTRLLRDHSHTLTSVSLDLKPSTYIYPLPEVALHGWMESINPEPHILANLTTLEMYPGNHDPYRLITLYVGIHYPVLEPTTFAFCVDLLRRSVDTLTKLVIRNRFLSFDEVESVLSVFASRPPPLRLTTLDLGVERFDVRTLNSLARELPCLRKLSLCAFGDFWTDRDGGRSQADLDDLQIALRDPVYADWKLQEIRILVRGRELDRDIMELIVRSIPSLRMRGLGDLKTDRNRAIC